MAAACSSTIVWPGRAAGPVLLQLARSFRLLKNTPCTVKKTTSSSRKRTRDASNSCDDSDTSYDSSDLDSSSSNSEPPDSDDDSDKTVEYDVSSDCLE